MVQMIITVGDIWSAIYDPLNHMSAVAIMRQVCRARPENYQYMPKYKAGLWDGYVSLTMPRKLSWFPTGLLSLVVDALQANNYTVELQRHTPDLLHKTITPDVLQGITLRDYQVTAANALLEYGRGVAAMATNSGKTEVMAAVAWALGCDGVLILELSKELLHQTAERLSKRLNVSVGRIGDGLWDVQPVTVATIQTLVRHKDAEFRTVCIMVDECHHTSSDMALDVLANLPGYYRFGFSGTPLMYDKLRDLKLAAYTGPVVCTVSNQHLIRDGYSARPTITMIELDQPDDMWDADYQSAYDALIVNSAKRNAAIASAAMDFVGTVLVLVTRLAHGKLLQSLMPGSTFIHGGDSSDKRASVLAAMASIPGIYIATPIFDEGVDVPAVDRIIMAGGGKSHVKLLQRVGRGLRQKAGHNLLSVVDFLDDGNAHLLNHSERRLDTYASQGFKLRKS